MAPGGAGGGLLPSVDRRAGMRCHAPMSALQTNRSMPESTVIPVLPYPDLAAAIEWLTTAFGFTLRMPCVNALMPWMTSGTGNPAT